MPKIKKTARRPLKRSKIAGASVTIGRCRKKEGKVASVIMRRDGKRVKIKYCATESEAKAIAAKWETEITNSGTAAAALLTDADKRAIADFYEKVKEWNSPPTLAAALNKYLADHAKAGVGLTVTQAADARIAELDKLESEGKRSKRHSDSTRLRLDRFVTDFTGRRLHSIGRKEIKAWIESISQSQVTRRNYKLAINPLFVEAIQAGELEINPLANLKIDIAESGNPEIFTPAEVTRFMATCPESIRAVMAIQFFAGVRSAEALKLTWDKVKLIHGVIDISANVAKTASRRLITITPNLRKWLEPLAKNSGPVAPLPAAYRYQLAAHRESLNFTWKDNGARHSFISYLMAEKANAAFVANQAGNSPGMIHKHYKALVTKREAAEYFAVVPDAGEKIIQMPTATAC